MAETTADVKRDIELTRERMTATLAQLERKLNLTQVVKENPWPALGVAFGAGLLLSGSRADVKAAAATAVATKGASGRLGTALDDIVANLMNGLGGALQQQVDVLVDQVKLAIGAPTDGARPQGATAGATSPRGFADASSSSAGGNGDAAARGGLTPSSAGSQGAAAGWGSAPSDASSSQAGPANLGRAD